MSEFLGDYLENNSMANLVILGDSNCRISNWKPCILSVNDKYDDQLYDNSITFERNSQDEVINNFGKKLIEICACFDLVPLLGLVCRNFPDGFTYICERGQSTVDHVLSTVDMIDLIHDLRIESRIESDHLPLTFTCGGINTVKNYSNDNTTLSKYIWDEDKAALYAEYLANENTQQKIVELSGLLVTDIELSLMKFNEIIMNAGKCMQVTIRTGGNAGIKNPWFDEECKVAKKEAKHALTKVRLAERRNDEVRAERLREYKIKRATYQNMVKRKKMDYKQNIFDKLKNNAGDSSAFWSLIKGIRSVRQGIPDIDMNKWEEHFNLVLNPGLMKEGVACETQPDDTDESDIIEVEELDTEITLEEVLRAISNLKTKKAAGGDGIIPEFLKNGNQGMIEFMVEFFNKIYNEGYYPKEWSNSIIVPIFKKGERTDPSNYRGISLNNIISKVYTGVLNERLYRWSEENSKIGLVQAGFRKQHSTIDHIYTLTQMVSNCLYGTRRKKFYCIFIDFKKAFDSVDRKKMWVVLKKIGVSSKFIRALKSMYNSVKGKIRVGSNWSGEIDCLSGVKQGCKLSPLLFSLMINEVIKKLDANLTSGYQFNPGSYVIKSLLFADDLALPSDTPRGLQQAINLANDSARELGLSINIDKTKVIVFRKGGFLNKDEKWHIDGTMIDVVNNYKYLGYTVTTKLSGRSPLWNM